MLFMSIYRCQLKQRQFSLIYLSFTSPLSQLKIKIKPKLTFSFGQSNKKLS